MKVIIVKPFTNPYVKEIKADLESMQSIVGGYIQAIYPFDDEVALNRLVFTASQSFIYAMRDWINKKL